MPHEHAKDYLKRRIIMSARLLRAVLLVLIILFICPALVFAQDLKPIKLLAPQTIGGRPLMQVLKDRKSSREFRGKELPLQVLSNMLWAAYGVNRPDSGKRTAPSAINWQEIDIYVATAHGLYLYDAKAHALQPVLSEDIRSMTGRQSFVKEAPVNLIYVADQARMGTVTHEEKVFYSAADTGFISQNVYLYCASEGLATVVRGSIDRPALEKAMRLRPEQKVILAQSVGYPKK
jgi:SagB-type dehydrogenase family enzyme